MGDGDKPSNSLTIRIAGESTSVVFEVVAIVFMNRL